MKCFANGHKRVIEYWTTILGDIRSICNWALIIVVSGTATTGALAAEQTAQQKGAELPLVIGVPYYLPKMIFNIMLTRELMGCEDNSLTVSQSSEITTEYVADSAAGYFLISADKLQAATKANNLTVTLNANGTLQALKNTSADKTGEIIANVLGGALKVATVALGVPTGFATTAVPAIKPRGPCNRTVTELLDKIKVAKDRVLVLNDTVSTKTAALEVLVKDSKEAKKLQEEIAAAKGEITTLQEAIGRHRQTLTTKQLYQVALDRATTEARLEPSLSIMRAWFEPNRLTNLYGSQEMECVGGVALKCDGFQVLPKSMVAHVGAILPTIPAGTKPDENNNGIVFREPVPTEIMICATLPCVTQGKKVANIGAGDLIQVQTLSLPQFGTYATLPYTSNEWFQTLTLEAKFADSGALTSLTYTSNARAETASASFKASVDQIATYVNDQRKSELDQVKYDTALIAARTARIQAETALKDAEKKRDAAQ